MTAPPTSKIEGGDAWRPKAAKTIAGIGGGYNSSANNLKSPGHGSRATGGNNGAGIGGGGDGGFGEHITVSGGIVEVKTARTLPASAATNAAAATKSKLRRQGHGQRQQNVAGSGSNRYDPSNKRSNGSNIEISGGEVTANGGEQEPVSAAATAATARGIGSSSGGEVTATGNGVRDISGAISNSGAGIGGGAGEAAAKSPLKTVKEATGNN